MTYIVVLIVLSLDQLTKYIISKNFSPGESLSLIKGFFSLTLVHNRGAAFGMLKGQAYLFIAASVFAVALIYLSLKKQGRNKVSLYSLSLALILAGALGNLIDRLSFGYVIDFLDFHIWPVFNIADSAITVGAILLGYSIIRGKDGLGLTKR